MLTVMHLGLHSDFPMGLPKAKITKDCWSKLWNY
jgi:hypothetical protein